MDDQNKTKIGTAEKTSRQRAPKDEQTLKSAPELATGLQRYRVTPSAGPFVAGRRPDKDGMLVLTARQAEYPLRNGEIEPVSNGV